MNRELRHTRLSDALINARYAPDFSATKSAYSTWNSELFVRMDIPLKRLGTLGEIATSKHGENQKSKF